MTTTARSKEQQGSDRRGQQDSQLRSSKSSNNYKTKRKKPAKKGNASTCNSDTTLNGTSDIDKREGIDKYHNCLVPCCASAREVALDIFPEIHDIFSKAVVAEYGDAQDNKVADNSNMESTCTMQPSLLGQLIRQHLIQTRQRERASISPLVLDNGHDVKIKQQTENNNTTKKKRRRKKKKDVNETGDCRGNSTNTSVVKENSATKAKHQPSDDTLNKALPDQSSSARAVSQLQNSENDSKVNDFLDVVAFLASSSTLSTAKDGLSIDSSLKNRTLPLLLSYLEECYEQNYRHQKDLQSQAPKQKNVSKQHLKVSDILPTISIIFLRDECRSIACEECLEDALAYMRLCADSTGDARFVFDVAPFPLNIIDANDSTKHLGFRAKKTIVGNVKSLEIPTTSRGIEEKRWNEEVETAFDYIALEEGVIGIDGDGNNIETTMMNGEMSSLYQSQQQQNVGDPQSFRLVFGPVTGQDDDTIGDKTLQLQKLHSTTKTGNCIVESSYPLTLDVVQDLVRRLILPCSLPELEKISKVKGKLVDFFTQLDERVTLTQEELFSLQKNIELTVCEIEGLFCQLGVIVANIESLLAEASGPSSFKSSFDLNASTKLQTCDSECESFLDKAVSLLLTLSSVALDSCAMEHHDSNWIVGILNTLWQAFDSVAVDLVAPALEYQKKVIQITTQSDVVPAMYCDSSLRSSYSDLLRRKKTILSEFHDLTENVLESLTRNSSDAASTTVLRRFCTIAVYFSHSPLCDGVKFLPPAPSAIDADCKELLSARSELVCKTIKGGKVDDILRVQSEKYKIVRNRILKAAHHFSIDVVGVQLAHQSAWKAESRRYEKRSHEDWKYFGDCYGGQPVDSDGMPPNKGVMHHLCKWSNVVLSQSRLFMLAQRKASLETSQPDKLPKGRCLPAQLERWLASTSGSVEEMNQEKGKTEQGSVATCKPETCEGGGGKRRLSCILSSFIYNWLNDRCMEWHADLAQKELLRSIGERDDEEHDSALVFGKSSATICDSEKKQKMNGGQTKKTSKRKKEKKEQSIGNGATSSEDLASHQSMATLALVTPGLPTVEPTETNANDELAVTNSLCFDSKTDLDQLRIAEGMIPSMAEHDQISDPKESDGRNSPDGHENSVDHVDPSFEKIPLAVPNGIFQADGLDAPWIFSSDDYFSSETNQSIPSAGEKNMPTFPLTESLNISSSSFIEEEEETKVGILDGSHFVTAEAYLTGRLEDILNMGKFDVSSTSKRKKISIIRL